MGNGGSETLSAFDEVFMFELRISSVLDVVRFLTTVTASAQPHGFWRNVGGSWQRD
jgi:hypothetical protein